ncbi:hypothetical protein HC251_06965 [Iamia sp. SCSIO 61187]|uniref:hypothetical protein n=1 Tax=Iamia sp. SCSIO 61187 TaxID=2722752 RepID=UPI001C62F10B|nr:hypothetical protein [Iamia sp. SCSIO 61187]QYG92205.1 hypothetical protein HC251_06965 [Iamia sp. SCSIO 61187]
MRRRAGNRRAGRWPRQAAAVALAVLLVGCSGSGGDDDPADAGAPSTDDAPSTTATTETTTTEPPTTTTPPRPEGAVEVPIDEGLARRLPELPGVERTIVTDTTFDERLCDSQLAPVVPEGQAEALYKVGAEEVLAMAAYRFAGGVAPYYVSFYTDALEACAEEAGERVDLGLVGVPAFAQQLKMEKGSVIVAVVLRTDVLWVLFQQRTDGDTELERSHLEAFLEAVEG